MRVRIEGGAIADFDFDEAVKVWRNSARWVIFREKRPSSALIMCVCRLDITI